jgi:cyclase
MQKIKTAGTLLILIFGAAVAAQERDTSPVSLNKISQNIYHILGGSGANGGVIIGENGILVIDAKMDKESVEHSLEAIREISDKPLRYLVNTHSDGDHIMGNRYFPGNVTIIAHENCRDDFFKENFGRESDWGEPEYYPFTPSITFRDKLILWLGKDQVELYYFGVGHTTGDIVVYVPGEKTAFIGDLYFSDRPQLIHSVKNGNSFEYVRTVTRMLETLDAGTFLSGHTDPVGRGEIENHIQGMVERQEKVKELIGQNENLAEILEEFGEDESRLVTSIYNELGGE